MCALLPLPPASSLWGRQGSSCGRGLLGFRDQGSNPIIVTVWRYGYCGELFVFPSFIVKSFWQALKATYFQVFLDAISMRFYSAACWACLTLPEISSKVENLTFPLCPSYPWLHHRKPTMKNKGLGTPVFIAALYSIAKTWNQPKCPSTEEWIKKMWYMYKMEYSVEFSSVAQSCPSLCDPMGCSMPDLPVHHQLQEFTPAHVHWVGDGIQPSHPLSSPSPPAFNLSQYQGLFQWVSSLHQVAKVLKCQLQY